MGKIYLQGTVLTAADLNASLSEAVNTTGTFVFTGSHTWGGTETFNGTETHNGVVTYNSTETHNGAVTYNAAVTLGASAPITSSNTISDKIGNVRQVPFNNQSAVYTLAASDSGKTVSTNSGVTVPTGVFSVGDNITIWNYSTTAAVTITQGTGVTMYWAGQPSVTTGNRVLSFLGLCTIICTGTNQFAISGAGLT